MDGGQSREDDRRASAAVAMIQDSLIGPAAAAPLERETLGEQGLAKRFEERMRQRKKQQFH
jgi:hypothetical protein